jgi:hypothetical protein
VAVERAAARNGTVFVLGEAFVIASRSGAGSCRWAVGALALAGIGCGGLGLPAVGWAGFGLS